MINNKLTEWLYYEHIYRWALDKSAYDDPKYVEMLPDKEKFLEYIMECNIQEFISTLVYIFKDQYPLNHMSIDSHLGWDEQKKDYIEGKCYRKANDIKNIYFIEDQDYWNLDKIRLEFSSLQPNAKNWVKQGLQGKKYQEHTTSGETVFSFENEILQTIKVTNKELLIQLNPEKLPE